MMEYTYFFIEKIAKYLDSIYNLNLRINEINGGVLISEEKFKEFNYWKAESFKLRRETSDVESANYNTISTSIKTATWNKKVSDKIEMYEPVADSINSLITKYNYIDTNEVFAEDTITIRDESETISGFFEDVKNKIHHLAREVENSFPKLVIKQHFQRLRESELREIRDPHELALQFIDPIFQPLFLSAELKATCGTGNFKTNIRCASFCEILYNKKYIVYHQQDHIKHLCKFADYRYNIDIYNALQSARTKDREEHRDNKKNKLPPLRNCF